MAMHNVRYVVVERSGYVGETDVTSFDDDREARKWIAGHYDADELDPDSPECLHVALRTDWTDDDGEERQEYMC